jgi:hypothetical protein
VRPRRSMARLWAPVNFTLDTRMEYRTSIPRTVGLVGLGLLMIAVSYLAAQIGHWIDPGGRLVWGRVLWSLPHINPVAAI